MTEHENTHSASRDDHDALRRDLALAATGDLTAERAAEIRAHVQECAACSTDWQQIQATLASLRGAVATPPTTVPADVEHFFEERLAPHLDGAAVGRARSPVVMHPTVVLLGRVAILVLAVGLGMFIEHLRGGSNDAVAPGASNPLQAHREAATSSARLDLVQQHVVYEQSARGRSGLSRGLLALQTLRRD